MIILEFQKDHYGLKDGLEEHNNKRPILCKDPL